MPSDAHDQQPGNSPQKRALWTVSSRRGWLRCWCMHRPTSYYYLAEPWALTSRYSDSYVQSHFDAVDMTGPAGGGFVFDTNSLHRGVVIGSRPRKTVILEFHGHGKLPRAFHSARHNACPSVKHKAWRTGTPGYSLYPPEY